MAEGTKNEHVKGLYLVIVALISLIGGCLLKDPIKNAFTKKYSQIGGVWKPHGDILEHCNISTIKDTFYIRMEGTYQSMDNWIIQGHGKTEGTAGDFEGKMIITGKKDPVSFPVWGHVEIAGSDQLGVTIFFDKKGGSEPNAHAYIRETQNSVEVQGDEKK